MDEYNLALLIMRVALGLTMAAHGYAKFFKGGRIAGTAGWFDSIGMRPGRIHAHPCRRRRAGRPACVWPLGFFTTFAALGFVGLMTVAWWLGAQATTAS